MNPRPTVASEVVFPLSLLKQTNEHESPRPQVRSTALDRVVAFRGIDGSKALFVPTLCRLYVLREDELPLNLPTNEVKELDTSELPSTLSELKHELQGGTSVALERKHVPGIALIVSQNCNLTCSYCLAKQGTFGLEVSKMNLGIVKGKIEELFASHPDISFLKFFGGEPTLRMDLIEDVCTFVQDTLKQHVHFAVTTNGTLSAARHMDVWRRFRVSVSVSVDGPAFIHDEERKDKLGRGSFEKAIAYIRVLRSHNFPHAVVGVFDDRHLKAGWTYLETIRFLNSIAPLTKVQFLETLGSASGHEVFEALKLDVRASVVRQVEEAVDEMINVCTGSWVSPSDQWLYDNNLMRFLSGIVLETALPYTHACTASNLTTIFPGGELTPCYTFSEESQLSLGRLTSDRSVIEARRQLFRRNHTWENLVLEGVRAPWYRGIVGDICVADMRNSAVAGVMRQSEFYAAFQETACRRLLQHLVSLRDKPLALARLRHAVIDHERMTGKFAYA